MPELNQFTGARCKQPIILCFIRLSCSRNRMSQKNLDFHLIGLSTLRGIGAIMVITCHIIELPNLKITNQMATLIHYFGYTMPLFFALSGFFLSYVYRIKSFNRTFLLTFWAKRFFRIAPLFYFMLFIWISFFFVMQSVKPHISDIFLNITFTYGFIPGKHASTVWAGWTLGVEAIFYLIFPILAICAHRIYSSILIWVFVCFFSGIVHDVLSQLDGMTTIIAGHPETSYAHLNAINQLSFFIAGIAAYRVWEADRFRHSVSLGLIYSGLAFFSITVIVSLPIINKTLSSISYFYLVHNIWGLIILLIILSVCYWPNRLYTNSITSFLGDISYSLYLIHPFFIYCLMLLGIYDFINGFTNGYSTLISWTITLLALIPISFLSYKFIEKPGITLGKKLIEDRLTLFNNLKFKSVFQITGL